MNWAHLLRVRGAFRGHSLLEVLPDAKLVRQREMLDLGPLFVLPSFRRKVNAGEEENEFRELWVGQLGNERRIVEQDGAVAAQGKVVAQSHSVL